MTTDSFQDNIDDSDNNIQPEKTFDEHVASLIHEFKEKIGDNSDVIVIVKPNDVENPHVFYKGHPYDITKLGVDFVRHMKEMLGSQLEC